MYYAKSNIFCTKKQDENLNLSKIGLIIRKINDDEYNDLLDGFKSLILVDRDLELAKLYYDLKNKKKKFADKEKIELFEEISKSENEKIILNIYNGLSSKVFYILTLDYYKKY